MRFVDVENRLGIRFFLDTGIPTAVKTVNLMIDGAKAKKGERNRLIGRDSGFVQDARYLALNFALWLDRFIVVQGVRFWKWIRMDADRYHSPCGPEISHPSAKPE